ncbi:GntR family transcriptional regulator [Actibacterium sp. MT2.3-13A]|uniref:GntR family transcriptional regulator n=1 Tax=Actibacterium sp. MT2.3-13A TaxID=2828332 RepID=UPI001BACF642|nr:GntR family transcriptional regulator [Actibacterium sp. MT2.3-13A]
MKKIEHQPLSDRAYQALRDSLQEGVFLPMQPMIIRTLAAEYGISATPIREALQRLVAERLLIVLPNRSIVVPRMTRQRFLQLMPIRVSLEGMAARLATPNFSEEEIKALSDVVQRVSETTRSFDAKTYLLLNREFHFMIYEKAQNPELLQMINDLWLKVGPVFTGLFDDNYYRQHANDEHQNILAAIEAGDAEAAQRYMQKDIDIAAKALLPLLPEEGDT